MLSFHSYLSNRLLSADEKQITVVEWNTVNELIAYGQTNGTITIAKVVFNYDQPGLYKIQTITSFATHKHEITAIAWNTRFNKLMSGDRNGLVVVWVERDNKWFPTVVSSGSGSPVTSIATNDSGENMVVAYENGQIFFGDIGINHKVVKCLEQDVHPKQLFTSTSGKTMYFFDENNDIYTVKNQGKNIEKAEFPLLENESNIVKCKWSKQHPAQLLIAYNNGDIVLHTKGAEENQFMHCDIEITDIVWSNSCQFFAVSGIVEPGRCQVQFFTSNLDPIRTLNVTGQNISDISFNRNDTQLVISVDKFIAIAQLLPINMWDFFDDTIVYAVHRNFSTMYDIVFFNTLTSELHIKSIDSLIGVSASPKSVLIAAKSEKAETSLLVLDKVGIPIASNFIQMDCKLFAKTDNYAIALSDTRICLWDIENDATKFVSLYSDPSAVCAQGNKLFISFTSNELYAYELPQCEVIGKYNVGSHIEKISVSIDMTRITMVNIFGGLSFIDIHSGKIAGKPRKETWSMKWAEDSPDLFVALERQKLYVYYDFNAQEAINSLTYICRFNSLEILTVDFTKLLIDPLHPKLEHFHVYETKLLRDLKNLSKCPEISNDEIVKHIRKMPHKKLWQLFGEIALSKGKYTTAEKAFIESQNQNAIMFIKRIKEIKSQEIQRGFAQWYMKNYEDAEKLFIANHGNNYAIEMWQSIPNWKRVIALNPERKILLRAHRYLADEAYNSSDIRSAASHYVNAEMFAEAIKCYSQIGDAESLIRLMNGFASDEKLLIDIGYRFIEIGSCDNAVAAFLKAGNPKLAVSTCVHLNHWDDALKLADKYKDISKQELMGQYAHYLAENSQVSRAISMFIKFKLPVDAAQLLNKEGCTALQNKEYLLAKKCFVISAQLQQDTVKDQNVWYYAEALHFMMLAHRCIFAGKYSESIYPAIEALNYTDFLGERTSALLALAGFYSRNFHQCSKGFITLEHSDHFTPSRQKRFKLLAVKIFGKNPPKDSDDVKVKCPKCNGDFSMLTKRCKCGFTPKRSIATGMPILGQEWMCTACKHFASLSEIKGLKVCPLCHAPINK